MSAMKKAPTPGSRVTSKPSTPSTRPSTRGTPRSAMPMGSLENPQNVMLEVKVGRKKAESYKQLVANRIKLLQAEEKKAKSKVEETNARAKEIYDMKQRNEELSKSRLQVVAYSISINFAFYLFYVEIIIHIVEYVS